MLSLDFSQIELRVGAFYCRDEKMLQTYRDGGDIHAQTTSVIYGIPFEQAADKNAEHYKERRTIAKNCNFGVFFGLFPRGLQKTLKFKAGLDTPLSDCERIIANLKSGYPQLSLWQEVVKRQAAARRYSETWLGRRRYLPNITSEDWGKKSFAERCAMNTPIQGTAADILKLALSRLIVGLRERPWLRPLSSMGNPPRPLPATLPTRGSKRRAARPSGGARRLKVSYPTRNIKATHFCRKNSQ